ncbi:MAG: 3-hydroxyacyl-CoA dehydrogenase NAD-binding domain-containing protein [Gammaproteobacteria bacterium]
MAKAVPLFKDNTQPEIAADHYQHWMTERDAQGIAWLALDKRDAGTNTLSEAVLMEFDALLDELKNSRPTGIVIRSGKSNGFIAGADVQEFRGARDPNALEARVRQAHQILNKLEGLPVPTVALIHGFCLGGGLELALACRYRIARSDAKLGLPEVKLGIHPGFGGTVRLTRLLPLTQAMDLMLTGRTLDAKSAKRMGLVDVVTEERHLVTAARSTIQNGLKRRRSPLVPLLNSSVARALLAKIMRRKTEKKVRPERYPAPYAVIDLWREHGGDRNAMLTAEAASVARLITGDTAQNLIRVFFLRERLKSLGKGSDVEFKHVHVVGAGTMGGDIAAWCALQGLYVTVQDQSHDRLAPAMERAARLFRGKIKEGGKQREAFDRLLPDLEGHGVAQADVVIEAIVEDPDAKRDLFAQIEPRLNGEAVLATNSSSIALEELSPALRAPGRLVGMHFFNPVAKMPLVEVIRGQDSSDDAYALAQAFAQRIDRLPLPVRSSPGFLVNRALMPYLLEAVKLLEEGVAAPTIDAAAEAFGMPMGPLELADRVGLDICLDVAKHLDSQVPDKLRELVESKHTGYKSGQGFYRYRDGVAQKGSAREIDQELQDRLILPLLNACVLCLREEIVEDADLVDAGLIFGTGFAPFRGGPMNYIRNRGREKIIERLEEFAQRFGERYCPDPGWRSLD